MEQEGTQEPARFDPRIAEPPAVPTLIPVLRPAGAEDAAAVGDLAIDPEDPGLLDLDPAESAHPAAAAVAVTAGLSIALFALTFLVERWMCPWLRRGGRSTIRSRA